MLRSMRQGMSGQSARDVRRKCTDLEVILDVDRQGIDDARVASLRGCRHVLSTSAGMTTQKPVAEMTNETLRRMTVPVFRHPAALAATGQIFIHGAQDSRSIAPRNHIRALLDGYRAFCVFTQRDAWYAESGGLFLYAAGIGQDHCCVCHQAKRLEVALRRKNSNTVSVDEVPKTKTLDVAARTRMQRKNKRKLHAHFMEYG